jgi:hypothetical protein
VYRLLVVLYRLLAEMMRPEGTYIAGRKNQHQLGAKVSLNQKRSKSEPKSSKTKNKMIDGGQAKI